MTNFDNMYLRRIAGGLSVAVASVLLILPFVAVGAFFMQIY
jgi:hypothetical protein